MRYVAKQELLDIQRWVQAIIRECSEVAKDHPLHRSKGLPLFWSAGGPCCL